MRIVPMIADRLLRVASLRWPSDLRTSMLREWSAELAVMRDDRSRGPVARALRQLRFALSLASSPPVEDEHGVPRGWRELLPGTGRALQPLLALFGAALLCHVLTYVPRVVDSLTYPLRRGPGGTIPGFDRTGIDWTASLISVGGFAVAVVLAALIGGWVGRRLPVAWAHHTRLGAAGSAVVAPFVVATGVVAVNAMITMQEHRDGGTLIVVPRPLPAILLWIALVTPLAALTVSLLHRGRKWWAGGAAIGLGLAALELTAVAAGWHVADRIGAATAPLWFPYSVLSLDGSLVALDANGGFVGGAVISVIAGTLRPLLIATAFVLMYGLRASRADVLALPAYERRNPAYERMNPAERPARAALARARAVFAFSTVAIGLALWAYLSVILTPRLADLAEAEAIRVGGPSNAMPEAIESTEQHLVAHEIRLAAIVLVVLALLFVIAASGPMLLPGILVAAAMVVGDSALDRIDARGAGAAATAFAFGIVAVALGWWLGRVLRPRDGQEVSEREVRRRFAAIATIAALCAPALLFHAFVAYGAPPFAFPVTVAVTGGLLAAVASLAALAARGEKVSRAVAAAVVCGPVLLAAALGMGVTSSEWFKATAGLGLPLVFFLIAVMTLGTTRPARRRSAVATSVRWTVGGVAAVALGLPMLYLQLPLAILIGQPLMYAAGYELSYDGVPMMSGTVLVAIPLALLVASRVAPRAAPASGVAPSALPEPAG